MSELKARRHVNFRGIGTPAAIVDALIERATALPPAHAWFLTLLALATVAVADYASGTALWFGPVYLLVICLPAWVLGERAGLLAGLLCGAMAFGINGPGAAPDGAGWLIWSVTMRVLSIVIVVMLVGAFRRSYRHEWQQARTDRLTGALTREALIEQSARRARAQPFALLAYLDLDGFKKINDQYGHAAGDALLVKFAAAMRRNLRPADSFARIGGDEFLCCLPIDDPADAQGAAEALHARINTILSAMPHPVGCSVGALMIGAGRAVDEQSIAQADRLMYRAKQSGNGLNVQLHWEGARQAVPPAGVHLMRAAMAA